MDLMNMYTCLVGLEAQEVLEVLVWNHLMKANFNSDAS